MDEWQSAERVESEITTEDVERRGRHAAPTPVTLAEASEKPAVLPPAKGHAVIIMMLAAFAALLTILNSAANAYDNDMWWLLATGREIVENGIPYTNPFSMFPDMGIVVQQWLAAVILYVVYSTFGITGAQVLVFVQAVALWICLYALCRVCRDGKRHGGEVVCLLIFMGFGAFQAYMSVRPHLYTMILFTLVLLVLEKYRRSSDVRLLVALPILVCIHVNLHASMAPFDLFMIALYVIPDIPTLLRSRGKSAGAWGFAYADYRRIPLLVALLVSAVALLVNPYGIDGALYLVNSYGAAGYGNYINEMGHTDVWADYGIAMMVSIVIGAVALGRNGGKRINVPLSVLFIVSIVLSLMHTRNVWLVALFAIPLAAQAFGRFSLWVERFKALRTVAFRGFCVVVLAVGVGYFAYNTVLPEASAAYERDCGSVPTKGLDYLDEVVAEQGIQKSDLKLYNSFNNGGYVEWRGYKAFIDPRPELWEPAITGLGRHYYQEFVDFAQSKTTTRELLEEYTFDYLIVYNDCDFAKDLAERTDYEVVLNCSGYKLWKHVDGITSDTATLDELESAANSVEDVANLADAAEADAANGNSSRL